MATRSSSRVKKKPQRLVDQPVEEPKTLQKGKGRKRKEKPEADEEEEVEVKSEAEEPEEPEEEEEEEKPKKKGKKKAKKAKKRQKSKKNVEDEGEDDEGDEGDAEADDADASGKKAKAGKRGKRGGGGGGGGGKKGYPPPIATVDQATIDHVEGLKAPELKDALRANDQLLGGNKQELVNRVLECLEYGCLPRCPTCARGRLKVKGGGYQCPGAMDDDVFMRCGATFTHADAPRVPWAKQGAIV